jgi:hypothetical protein
MAEETSKVTSTGPAAEDPSKAALASYEKNAERMQPGFCETDETTGLRVIHPAANPQQVNPIHDEAHEAAATEEAKVLTDKESTPEEKIEATAKSNEAEGAPSAIATASHEAAVESDREPEIRSEQQVRRAPR